MFLEDKCNAPYLFLVLTRFSYSSVIDLLPWSEYCRLSSYFVCTSKELALPLSVEDESDGRAERAAAEPSNGEWMRNCPSSRSTCLFYFSILFCQPHTNTQFSISSFWGDYFKDPISDALFLRWDKSDRWGRSCAKN